MIDMVVVYKGHTNSIRDRRRLDQRLRTNRTNRGRNSRYVRQDMPIPQSAR